MKIKKIVRAVASTLLCLGGVLTHHAWAGPLSLNPGQVPELRKLVIEDREAANQYDVQHKLADASLNDTPNPIGVVVGEGKLDSDPKVVASAASLKDMHKISALAWVWLVSDDKKYAQKGVEYILAWAKVNKPDGDPINESMFEYLIVAYEILHPKFASQDREFVEEWLRNRAIMLWNDPRHHTENWQSHRLKIVGMIATVLGDQVLWKTVEDGFKKQMAVSFLPSGESTDFKLRDALHYHLYSIAPLLDLACVAHERGHDWYNYRAPSGASLKLAVDFIEPYALGEKTHVEFAHSKVKFDQIRAQAGQGEYAPHVWSTCMAGPIFAQASCMDPDAAKLAVRTWCGVPHKNFVDWDSVVNYVKLKG
jgi:hypothetical protein